MGRCNHDHGQKQKPDYWTASAAAAELLTSLCSDAYWIAESIDFGFGLDGSILGLSPYGLGFGVGGAILSASGAAYSHYALNMSGQSDHGHDHESPDHDHEHRGCGHEQDEHHANEDFSESYGNVVEPLIKDYDDNSSRNALLEVVVDKSQHEEEPLIPKPEGRLKWWQVGALIGDFISHTGDVAGPINFTYDLATDKCSPLWAKALVKCGATLFAANGSVANVRTCYKSMKQMNAAHEEAELANLQFNQVVIPR